MNQKLSRLLVLAVVVTAVSIVAVRFINKADANNDVPQLLVQTEGSESILSTTETGAFHRTTRQVSDNKLIALPGNNLRVMTWKERGDGREIPYYAVSLDGKTVSRVAEADYNLMLRYGRFDPLVDAPAVAENLRTKNDAPEKGTYIVQFATQPLEEYRTEIKQLGGKVFTYLPNHAHLVQMNAETRAKVEALPFVRWVGRYEPAYKLEEELLDGIANNRLAPAKYNVMVLDRGAEMQGKLAAAVELAGGKVDLIQPEGFRMEVTLDSNQLVGVAHDADVLFIDRWSAPETDMDVVRAVSGANFIDTTLGYRGQGVRAEVMDGGLRTTHTDFQTGGAPIIHGSVVSDSHGTATYGINFGRGTTNPAGKGILPEAQGIIASYNNISGGSRYTHTAELKQAPYFAVYQSNSWGSALTTAYTTISAEMDDILFINDFTLLNSQSNAGSQQSRPQAWAKNVVSIGGVRHFGTASFTDDRWQNGASVGPAADGRLKPELAHFYDGIFTTTSSSDTAYTTGFGGTSAATPITAGHFGIFFQMWHNGVFGNTPTGATVFESRPRMTTAKAVMINTAIQWEMTGTDLTRARQGFGRVDVTNLYNLRSKMLIVNETDVLTNLQTKTYNVTVPAGSTDPLKVTMTYADPMGSPSAARARINDLTLKVTAPNGDVYWGNNGLGVGGGMWSTSGGTANVVDTVENVFIQTPAAGVWTIEVSAPELVTDARTETPGVVDADYALVVSGIQTSSAPAAPTNSRADFDGDGRTDVSVFRNGAWFVQRSSQGFVGLTWGSAGDQIVPGDYDGDNRTDFAIYRPTNTAGVADFYIINSQTSTFAGVEWGGAGDVAKVGDFDNNNRDDYAVYRASANAWYVLSNPSGAFVQYNVGAAGDVPVQLDYDGDGRTDPAAWTSLTGVWTIRQSSTGTVVSVQWGQAGDKLVPGDYVGNDNRDELAVWRLGAFFIRKPNGELLSINLNGSAATPVPGDYDGDGTDDVAFYRNGTWFWIGSTSGPQSTFFGLNSDTTILSAYTSQ
jgi:serine protease AprX